MTSTATPAARWERVYVFISSTFNDMHAERDYLIKRVFPQLADWCEQRRLRMIDIDLRWGVTELDATRNRSVVDVCLKRIDECRPFFICFLGQRYGWVPRSEDVSAQTFETFQGLTDAVDEGRSVTELEILHSVVRPFGDPGLHRPSDQALFYQRHPASLHGLPTDPPQLRRTYTDAAETDPTGRRFLLERRRTLRRSTIPATGRPLAVYRGIWSTSETTPELTMPLRNPAALPENVARWRKQWLDAGVSVEGLDVTDNASEEKKARAFNDRLTRGRLTEFTVEAETLASRIQRDLRQAIEARFPDHQPIALETPLAIELSQQEQFQFAASEGFVERADDFTALDDYAAGASDRPFVLSAPGGAGKSMLLAKWIERKSAASRRTDGATLHYRFIGGSDQSTASMNVIALLLRELRDVAQKIDDEIPEDPITLRQRWPDALARAGQRGRVTIVIDALDQLQSGLNDLTWIPRRLPENVKFIVSLRRDAPRADAALEGFRRSGALISEVRPFASLDDRRKLVRSYLSQYLKELDEQHIESAISNPAAANPLYLKILLTELRVFGSFLQLGEKIRTEFGDTPVTAFNAVLRRLETDTAYTAIDSSIAVPLIFGLLAHARRGLTAQEIATILCAALGKNKDDPIQWDAAMGATYLALRQVRPFLARRQSRADFFYETFRIAAAARYTSDSTNIGAPARSREDWNRLLADYFHSLPLWISTSGEQRHPNARKVSELPYHLTFAGDEKRLAKTLTDLDFVEAKCAAGMAYDLVEDYERVAGSLRTEAIAQFADFLRQQAHVLSRWPDLTFQQAANTVLLAADKGQNAPAKAAVHRQLMGLEYRPWIRQLNREPPSNQCFMTLSGHNGSVTGVVASKDSARVISAGVDRSLRVWDLRTGGAMETAWDLVAESVRLEAIPNSTLVAVPSADRKLTLWDYEYLQSAAELDGPRFGVSCMAVDSTGRWLALGTSTLAGDSSAKTTSSIVLYDLTTNKQVDIGLFPDRVDALAVSENAGVIVWASGSRVRVFDPRSRETKAEFKVTGETVTRIRFSHDQTILAIGQWGNDIPLFDTREWRPLRTIYGRLAISQDVAFDPTGEEIAVCGLQGSIKIWNVHTGDRQTTFRGHTEIATGISYTPDGKRIVTSSADGTIRVWNPEAERDFYAVARKFLHREFDSAYSAHSSDVADGKFELLLDTVPRSRKHWASVSKVEFAPSGRRAISISWDKIMRAWSFDTGECEKGFEGHEEALWDLALSGDGRRIATSDRSATIKVWDAEGKELATRSLVATKTSGYSGNLAASLAEEISRPTISPISFAYHNRFVLFATSLDQLIHVCDSDSLLSLFELQGHSSRIRRLIAIGDGSRIVSASDQGEVLLWDLGSRQPIARGGPKGSGNVAGEFGRIAFASGGRIACAWDDGSVHLLHPDTLQSVATLVGHSGRVTALSASEDVIAATHKEGRGTTVDVWQLPGTTPVFSESFTSDHVHAVCERGGRRVAIGGIREPLTIRELAASSPIRRFPEELYQFEFCAGRLIAGNDVGDVFLLELAG